jgi:tripartite-type tricarboxylate transporter receptor subunit TctC
MRKTVFFFLILAVGLVFVTRGFCADARGKYPKAPIEIVVTFSAGGPVDLMARTVGDAAQRFLGQPLVVVNRPGAAGSVAAADVIASRPDGYKLLAAPATFFANTVKTQKIPFNPADLVPLASFVEDKIGLAVRGDAPWKTLNELLEYGRKNPGKITWGHSGRGNSLHIVGLTLFRKAGVETIDVPYKGLPEAASALLGGHIEAYSGSYLPIQDHVRGGKLRYLVVYSDKRYSDLPSVPCAEELGFPQAANLAVFFGMFIHRDTPKEIQATLVDAFQKTAQTPEFKALERIGVEPRFGGPDFMRQAIKKAGDVGHPILKELGLYLGRE